MKLYLYVEDPALREKYKQYLETRRHTDSGVDVFVPVPSMKIEPHTTAKIGLGIIVATKDYLSNSCPCLLLPRSSISKTPLRLANSIGLIDAGYRGELCAVVDNISDDPYEINYGDRLFQICSHDFMPFMKFTLVEQLEGLPPPPDNRGSGGFGSTGK